MIGRIQEHNDNGPDLAIKPNLKSSTIKIPQFPEANRFASGKDEVYPYLSPWLLQCAASTENTETAKRRTNQFDNVQRIGICIF